MNIKVIKEPCKKCGSSERLLSGKCKPCAKKCVDAWRLKNGAAWYEANAERIKSKNSAYREENPEKVKQLRKAKYERDSAILRADPEKMAIEKQKRADYYTGKCDGIKAMGIAYRLENIGRVRAARQAKYAANSEDVKKKVRAWQKLNPETVRLSKQNRRAKESGGRLSKGLAEKLIKLQSGKCICCGQPLGSDYHLDHINPLSRGGSNTDDNIQLLRKTCNLQKHAKDPIEFMQMRGFLL